jgi:hypothetical protein
MADLQTLIGAWPIDRRDCTCSSSKPRVRRRRIRAGSRSTGRTACAARLRLRAPDARAVSEIVRALPSSHRVPRILNSLAQVVVRSAAPACRTLPGHRALGYKPRRSRQPPSRRTRKASRCYPPRFAIVAAARMGMAA